MARFYEAELTRTEVPSIGLVVDHTLTSDPDKFQIYCYAYDTLRDWQREHRESIRYIPSGKGRNLKCKRKERAEVRAFEFLNTSEKLFEDSLFDADEELFG